MDDSRLAEAIDDAPVTGAVAMLGNGAGETYARAFGVRDLAIGAPMAVDTIFQIASMTKAVASVGALMLVEQGKLSLDAPIGGLLPELADPQVIDGFGDDGTVRLRPAKRPITLKHLLTHTSGFGYDFMSADMARARGDTPAVMGARSSLISPLLFDPGDRWEYGISTDWAGLAIEAATGERLDAWLDANLIAPLGMTDTSFFPTPEQRARAATLYANTPSGLMPMPLEIGGGPEAEFVAGGAGLWSTAPDYLRFCRLILNGGMHEEARMLSAETVALLTANQIGGLRAGKMDSIMPELSGPFDLYPDMHTGWSLAFLTNPETGPHGRSPGSLAWAGIANCYYWIDRNSDVAGVFMSQLLPFGDPQVLAALGALEAMAYAKD